MGKTTLSLGLVRRGYAFLADDDIFLNSTSLLVTPFLRAVHLRQDSLLKLGVAKPRRHVASTGPEDRFYTTVQDLIPKAVMGNRNRLQHLVLPPRLCAQNRACASIRQRLLSFATEFLPGWDSNRNIGNGKNALHPQARSVPPDDCGK